MDPSRRQLTLTLAATLATLAGCAGLPPAPPPPPPLDDALFRPASERIDAADVFALSEPMRSYLREELGRNSAWVGVHRRLVDALYRRGGLRLEYDATSTRNAAEAFDARAGNCLSLVVMTAAFAKALDLPVTYQSALVDESWSRLGNLYLRSGHVNVTLGRRLIDAGNGDRARLTIDFLPPSELAGLKTRDISEATVVAMFMNNRAAEALAAGRVDDAYWWVREALRQDPGFGSAWNTLGVVYQRHGQPALADRAYAALLEREPGNTRAMGNRLQVLTALGREDEAEVLRQRLAVLEPDPPYHHFELGMQAMRRGDWPGAREHFAREVARSPYNAEFHYWLGLAHYRLGEQRRADRHLALARDHSTTRGDHDRYAAKLAWMRARL